MARKVLIMGQPGTGKSTGIATLDPTKTFVICPDEKDLPFKGWKDKYKTVYDSAGKLDLIKTNFFKTTKPNIVLTLLNKISADLKHINVVVLDTITLMMVSEFMDKMKEKGFEKYSDMALDTYNVLKSIDSLREDLTVIVIAHVENAYDSDGVLRTSFMVPGGKLVGEKIKVEGMFTTVLYSEVIMEDAKPKYYFITQNNGKNTCKSPAGMFDTLKIPNDFAYVIEQITKFETE